MGQNDQKYLLRAIELSIQGVRKNKGGPFGAVIVKNNRIIAKGMNEVTSSNDPTAHAEIVAIRGACKKLRRFDLNDCILYSSCEPCPMCLAAIYWARIPKVFYANTKKDATKIGFDDQWIEKELSKPKGRRKIKMQQVLRKPALKAFVEWEKKGDKVCY